MGHGVKATGGYQRLQRQLDRTLAGAPPSPVLLKILQLLYRPDEAELAAGLPGSPTPLKRLARRLKTAEEPLGEKLQEMAQRGLVIDLKHQGVNYYSLAPVAIGFFEFTYMRVRPDLPMAELSRLFDQYMDQDDRFTRSAFRGQTQIGRSLVREESLPEDDHTEILDWERASHIIRSASPIGVSLCACRHKASHVDRACGQPLEVCLSLNTPAESLIRNGFAKPLTVAEAMDVLEQSKQAGLAQTADNVQRKVTYICNCCGCCCEMFRAATQFGLSHPIVTSNWIMHVDPDKCKGCGKCVKACPIRAISLDENGGNEKPTKLANCDETLCVGCGVCYSACRLGAVTMKPRPKRTFTPETVFDRVVAMSIERGELADLLFDNPQRLSHRALGRLIAVLEKSPPYKAAMAIKPLRSAFLNKIVSEAKKQVGPIRDALQ